MMTMMMMIVYANCDSSANIPPYYVWLLCNLSHSQLGWKWTYEIWGECFNRSLPFLSPIQQCQSTWCIHITI